MKMETEFKQLLDREKHIEDVKKYFSNHLNTLEDMVNYGSWLIPRAYDSSKKGWTDIVTIGVLLKQIVRLTDSIEVLVSNAIVLPGFLQGRAAFEASLFIEWILKEDNENRAKHYYVSNLRNKRSWALRLIEGTIQQEQFSNDTEELASHIDFNETDFQELAKEQLADINRVLAQEDLKIIDDELEKLYQIRKIEPNWYAPITKRNSVRKIARNVNRLPEYIFFYEIGSKVVHSSSYTDHIKISKGKRLTFEPIRNLSEMNTLLRYAMLTAIHSYRIIVEKYRPGERRDFANKYRSDWQQSFLNIPSINYKSINE